MSSIKISKLLILVTIWLRKMTNLDEYAKKELSKGFSRKEVRETLLKAGWPSQKVDEALKNSSGFEFPQHLLPTPKFMAGIALILIVIIVIGTILYNTVYAEQRIVDKCSELKHPKLVYNCLNKAGLIQKYLVVNKEPKQTQTDATANA
jgi:hypothetical protein